MNSSMRKSSIVIGIIIVMIGASFVPIMLPNVKADPSDGLVGYWNFDDGTATDQTQFSNDGTIYGNAQRTQGISGQGLLFDGENDYVTIPDSNSIRISGDITISAWIKTSELRYLDPIISKGPGDHSFGYYLGTGTGYPPHQASFQLHPTGEQGFDLHSVETLSAGTWYHIVGTRSGTTAKIYIDGELSNTVTCFSGPIRTNTYPLDFGAHYSYSALFKGVIDEVRIYNRALSPSEIQYLHDNPGGSNQPNVPWLHVDGNKIKDENGQIISLRGVSIADPFYLDSTSHFIKNDFVDLKNNWKVNIIRVPIHPDWWNENQNLYFQKYIKNVVDWSIELGIYVLIDWHAIGSPFITKNCSSANYPYNCSLLLARQFWKKIAETYSDTPNVLYEIFNEPAYITWSNWRAVAGILINDIIGYNPNALIFVGGVNWSYDLRGVKNFPISDDIVYVVHPYPLDKDGSKAKDPENKWIKEWDDYFGYLTVQPFNHPVFASEWGCIRECSTNPWIVGTPDVYGKYITGYMQTKGMGWTAWCWHTEWDPKMFINWYTTNEYGTFVKGVLDGSIAITKLKINVYSPVDLHLYDSHSRHVGINYSSNEIEIGIPNTWFSGSYSEPQTINISNPLMENYNITLVGREQGNYNLSIEGFLGNGTRWYIKNYTGQINIGENRFYLLSFTADIDNIPPITTKTIGYPVFGINNKWVSSLTEFNLTASENVIGSGINTTFYRIWYNGIWTPWNEYTGNFTLTGEGKHYLEYYSVDNAGNVEETHNQTHYVDDIVPVVTISASPSSLWPPNNKMKNVLISGSATDAGSGIAPLVFSVEDEYNLVKPTITYFGQIIQLQAMRYGYDMNGRTYTITATATDNLGHVTTASTIVRVPHDQGN